MTLQERIEMCGRMIEQASGLERRAYTMERIGLHGSRPVEKLRDATLLAAYELGLTDRATLLRLEEVDYGETSNRK